MRSYQATLGSPELRRRAGGQAEDLRALGVRLAAATDRPARALWWMEAIRSAPEIDAAHRQLDPETFTALESLRDATRRLNYEPLTHMEATQLRRDQAAFEEVIRRRSRHAAGPGRSIRPLFRTETLAEQLGDRALVEYAVVGDRLCAVVLNEGEVRLVDVAPVGEVRRSVAQLRLALKLALSYSPARTRSQALFDVGTAVDRLLLGTFDLRPGTDIVLVPDGPTVSIPWSLLPSLESTKLTVAHSAAAWLRTEGRQLVELAKPRVLVVVGGDLHHGEAEAEAIGEVWKDQVTVLTGRDATVSRVLDAMTRSDIVHVAAHGTFRGDNPLLSAIRLHDGPLTGFELTQISGPAWLAVLSCCDAGQTDPESGISFSQLLSTGGVRATVASVSPVPDAPAVRLMAEFHRELAKGNRPAAALTASRRSVGGPLSSPSSAGFVCFGNG
jgi:hypothetical protein